MSASTSIVLTSLIGDALALGPHWIYDQSAIATQLGAIAGYADPMASYHPGKGAGDFTHYGDQTMVLLRSVAAHGTFQAEAFAADWQAYWGDAGTISYRDGATRTTLQNLAQGRPLLAAASSSHDIAGAARIAPLFLLPWASSADLMAAARAQTAITHADPDVIETAAYFAHAAFLVREGMNVADALHRAAGGDALPSHLKAALEAAAASSNSSVSDQAAALAHGQDCSVSSAFPLVCHFLLRYPSDTAKALTQNALVGGDSAARGLLIGLVLGARPDAEPLPEAWLDGLRARGEIQQLADQLAVTRG